MILHELTGLNENHPVYRRLEVENGVRQYDFLRSIVEISGELGRGHFSQHVLKALNFHAITCLHAHAGEYRPCEVEVGNHRPPAHFRVGALMEDFVNEVNFSWGSTDSVVLASYVLWKLNWIHPFVNGNGRTARAASYFVVCLHSGRWLPGTKILPELIRENRDRYVEALRHADASASAAALDLRPLHKLLSELLEQQLASAEAVEVAQNGDQAH